MKNSYLDRLHLYGVSFSRSDIKRGITITIPPDIPIMRALGIIYGDGYSNTYEINQLTLSGRKTDFEFYERIPKIINSAFNFPIKQPSIIEGVSDKERELEILGKPYRFKHPILYYASKALLTFLSNYLKFPKNKEEKLVSSFHESILQANKEKQSEFLKFYIGSTASFRPSKRNLGIVDLSWLLLGDVINLTRNLVKVDNLNLSKYEDRKTWKLVFYENVARRLWFENLCNENPYLRERMKEAFG